MRTLVPLCIATFLGASSILAQTKDVSAEAARIAGELESTYKKLHAAPELSNQEEKTANFLADQLQSIGFEVTCKVGGHGVAGVLKNGSGPTLLLRTDMDALPITEQTGAPY